MKVQIITHFPLLVKMWLAGNGEFYFANLNTSKRFCVRFKTALVEGELPTEAEVWCTVVNHKYKFKSQIFFNKIGKINLNDGGSYGYNNTHLTNEMFQKLWDMFHWVNKQIRSGALPTQTHIVTMYNCHCCRCGLPLITAQSIAQGFGDDCLTKYEQVFKGYQLKLF